MREFGVQIMRLLLLAGCLCASLGLFAADSGPTAPPSLNVARYGHSVFVRSDGMVYVVLGRASQTYQTLFDLEAYDLAKGSVILPSRPNLAPVGTQGGESATPLTRDHLMVCKYRSCQVYDPLAANWSDRTVAGAINSPFVTLADGKILRAGGSFGFSTDETFVIDPETLSATQVGKMSYSTADFNPVRLLDGRVFVAGGHEYAIAFSPSFSDTRLVQSQIYDPTTQTWSSGSPMRYNAGSVGTVVLPDGRVLAGGGEGQFLTIFKQEPNPNHFAEIYDPAKDAWTLADGVRWLLGESATLLPDGSVLLGGGAFPNYFTIIGVSTTIGVPTNQTLVWNPATGSVRQGRPMTIPRASHGVALLPDGTVLAMGGYTTGGVATASVEVLSYGQPKTTLSLNPDFYIATANQSSATDDGFWGLQATIPGNTNGGMFFGGLLAPQGSEVAFASFTIAESQNVTIRADLSPLPNSAGILDVSMRLLDGNKNPVAPATSGTGSVTWTGQLAPGLYVAELRSGPNVPATAINGTVIATRLQGIISAGGSLAWSAGVTGYLAFPVSEKKDATFQVFNEQSYGIGRGAGSVVLTVYDGARNVLKKLAPGGIDLLAQKP